MKQWLLNIWNAQRNARDLCALGSRHEWLASEHRKVTKELDEKCIEVQSVSELAMTLAVGYRAALGNPVDLKDIPVSIQEAHSLRGSGNGWRLKDDVDFGRRYYERKAKLQSIYDQQLAACGLSGRNGWQQ